MGQVKGSNSPLRDESALRAMANAVQRARGAATSTPDPGPTATDPAAGAEQRARHDLRRPLRGAAKVVAAMIVVLLIVLVAVLAAGSGVAPTSDHGHLATGSATHHPPATAGPGGGSPSSSTLPTTTTTPPVSSTTTSPAAPAAAGGAPVIASLAPAQGAAGTTVTVSGTNLISADGQIVATVAGQPAPTTCPSPTTCTVVVPSLPPTAPASEPLTLSTATGPSNTLNFTYTGQPAPIASSTAPPAAPAGPPKASAGAPPAAHQPQPHQGGH